ncbi:MAG: hypothetical protein RMK29_12440 [Myxococcales bacterium]|nr:hypothetical protein [Myxococcota bacterium]MDW8282514.1 hypothetical protein [Myxococcales bacterium]
MWASSYLPHRKVIALSTVLLVLVVTLVGLCLHLRRCPGRSPPVVSSEVAVRLHLGGTPGACVRIDGHVVGPIPAEVELALRGPRRVFVHACKSGYLEFSGELELRPGVDVTHSIWLSRGRRDLPSLLVPPRAMPCPCQL